MYSDHHSSLKNDNEGGGKGDSGSASRSGSGSGVRNMVPAGWCSWYHFFEKVSEKDLTDNIQSMQARIDESQPFLTYSNLTPACLEQPLSRATVPNRTIMSYLIISHHINSCYVSGIEEREWSESRPPGLLLVPDRRRLSAGMGRLAASGPGEVPFPVHECHRQSGGWDEQLQDILPP